MPAEHLCICFKAEQSSALTQPVHRMNVAVLYSDLDILVPKAQLGFRALVTSIQGQQPLQCNYFQSLRGSFNSMHCKGSMFKQLKIGKFNIKKNLKVPVQV